LNVPDLAERDLQAKGRSTAAIVIVVALVALVIAVGLFLAVGRSSGQSNDSDGYAQTVSVSETTVVDQLKALTGGEGGGELSTSKLPAWGAAAQAVGLTADRLNALTAPGGLSVYHAALIATYRLLSKEMGLAIADARAADLVPLEQLSAGIRDRRSPLLLKIERVTQQIDRAVHDGQ